MRPAPAIPRAIALLVLVVGMSTVAVGAVSAHTDLDFTLPAEGTTVGEPVTEISVGFTEMVALVGNGFEVIDPQGNVLQPFVVTDDDTIFRLQLDPPLAGGQVVVSYTVNSLDGHVIEGSFTFTAAAEPPPPTTQPPVTSAPATSAPATSAPTTTVEVSATPSSTAAAATDTADVTSTDMASTIEAGDGGGDSSNTVLLVVLIAIVLGAGGFLLARARRQS
jgi:methionine-rich copper-binding protein CopC